MTHPPPPPTDPPGGTIVLLVLGLLVLVPSGLCTGFCGIIGLSGLGGSAEAQGYAYMFLGGALILGMPFVIAGGAMLWIGIRRWRRR